MRKLLVIISLLLAVTPAPAQHLGGRQQWQPQITVGGFDPDRRLEQTVKLDLLGRSAVSTLAIISEASNVSLYVAPEDLNTVGERKLSIFALDAIRLKDLMVQIPEALVECHWDVDKSGKEPVYYLHRNSGVDQLVASLRPAAEANLARRGAPARAARLEALRKALAMSPEELAEPGKTDMLLVDAVQNAETRAFLEGLVGFSQEHLDQFVETGRLRLDFCQLPSELQRATEARLIKPLLVAATSRASMPLEDVQVSSIEYYDAAANPTMLSTFGRGPHFRLEISFSTAGRVSEGAAPARIDRRVGTDLLQSPSPSSASAVSQAPHSARLSSGASGLKQTESKLQEAGKAPGGPRETDGEPTDPELRALVELRLEQPAELANIQRLLAEATGLCVVSDYFTDSPLPLPGEAASRLPLWQLLTLLAEQRGYRWEKAGRSLVFHSASWSVLMGNEIPEAALLACRARLKENGRLTLEDAAALCEATSSIWREGAMPAAPQDLLKAGLNLRQLIPAAECLRVYTTLSADQAAKARRPSGLACAEMTHEQQRHIGAMLHAADDPTSAVFRVEEAAGTERIPRYTYTLTLGLSDGKPQRTWRFAFPQVGKRRVNAANESQP
jgi:hypothetical protein